MDVDVVALLLKMDVHIVDSSGKVKHEWLMLKNLPVIERLLIVKSQMRGIVDAIKTGLSLQRSIE
jgi:hypothetical protein